MIEAMVSSVTNKLLNYFTLLSAMGQDVRMVLEVGVMSERDAILPESTLVLFDELEQEC